jgi:altronate hydrolase
MEFVESIAAKLFLKIHPDDNVLVALKNLSSGTDIAFENIHLSLQEDIPAKHKFFMHDMAAGEEVIMYGVLVGKVQHDIRKGQLMTTSNTQHAAGTYAYRGVDYKWKTPDITGFQRMTFNGYK